MMFLNSLIKRRGGRCSHYYVMDGAVVSAPHSLTVSSERQRYGFQKKRRKMPDQAGKEQKKDGERYEV